MNRWTILTLGCFSRNRYWGEEDTRSYRRALCTSTMITTEAGKHILVDPAVSGADLVQVLDERCGMEPADVDYVFVTHHHGDHYVGLTDLPQAVWLVAPGDVEQVRLQLPKYSKRIFPAMDQIVPGVKVIALPGHTMGLSGLLFESEDGMVAVAGDSVMTRDFFKDRRGYYNSIDMEASTCSIDFLMEQADIVVPGHGNYFLTHRAQK
ncbi:MBL fold metallo-hydrolase [Massilimaliae timonensis]|uniref:MBL fold metallo-hydrolase n=1 Tax=Massiliimalia timonensis TaxID=1987501 RepID=A0A8J6P5S7_9FIRM|nr:MBL fold metallo-hydrolase [Massiliimalia timonensis]MBC8609630.1 MBL fold metallo-hydrolase [Massiliimalia timonensis]